jgi:hypothetical protein
VYSKQGHETEIHVQLPSSAALSTSVETNCPCQCSCSGVSVDVRLIVRKLTGCDTVHHPVENLQMLESGRTQLATAQADISPEPRARALAVL